MGHAIALGTRRVGRLDASEGLLLGFEKRQAAEQLKPRRSRAASPQTRAAGPAVRGENLGAVCPGLFGNWAIGDEVS